MWRCFADTVNGSPFSSRKPLVDLNERNMAMNQWQRMSEEFNFSQEDRVPDTPFNEVLWFAVKGEKSICPPPVHAAFLKTADEEDDDD
jgi:hypothetical protein